MLIPAINKLVDQLLAWMSNPKPGKQTAAYEFSSLSQIIAAGDVILLENHSHCGKVISAVSSCHWSSAALYIGKFYQVKDPAIRERIQQQINCQTDSHLIIQSSPDKGIHITILDDLTPHHLRICRPKELTEEQRDQLIAHLLQQSFKPSQNFSRWEMAKFLIPWALLPLSWRMWLYILSHGKLNQLLSPSFITQGFDYVQFPVLPLLKRQHSSGTQLLRQHPPLSMPSDFDHSPYFEVVKYPFLAQEVAAKHWLVPWQSAFPAKTTVTASKHSTTDKHDEPSPVSD